MGITMEITMELWIVILGGVTLSVSGVILGICFKSNRKADDISDFSVKDKESEVSDESDSQTVTVYDDQGNVIKQYTKCSDVEGEENCVKFDDKNGKSHEIYSYSTVIVDEE